MKELTTIQMAICLLEVALAQKSEADMRQGIKQVIQLLREKDK